MTFMGVYPYEFRSVTEFKSDAEYQAYSREATAHIPMLPKHNRLLSADGKCWAVKRKRREGEAA